MYVVIVMDGPLKKETLFLPPIYVLSHIKLLEKIIDSKKEGRGMSVICTLVVVKTKFFKP
jgi:hypothetical protein